MFAIDASSIDRSLPVPVGKQLYGLLSYVLAFGDMPKGPSAIGETAGLQTPPSPP